MKYRDKLRTLQDTLHPRSFSQTIRREYNELYLEILSQTANLDKYKNVTLKSRVFHYLNPSYLTDPPVCDNCGTRIDSLTKKLVWSSYCSTTCKGRHNSAKSRDKSKITCNKRWGVDNPAQLKEIQEKMLISRRNRLGVDHSLQSPIIQEQKRTTMLERYGVEHAAQHPDIQKKMIFRYQANWGVDNPSTRHITQDTKNKLNDPMWLERENQTKPFAKLADELGVSTYLISRAFSKFDISPAVHNYMTSIAEIEIINHIKSILTNGQILISDRTAIAPFELDIYLPVRKLAFEYNGLYYHSEELGRDKNYHLQKTERCASRGIRLIHIWESDYFNNKDIVLSKINNMLRMSSPLYARKCQIRELTLHEARPFLDQTHIQGYCNSTVRIGLIYNDEIVACMTFIKSRFNSSAQWELLRYSSKLNHSVVGGFSRLLKNFTRTFLPESIISYSDKCWSVGNVYKKNGFEHLRTSKPSYFYTQDCKTVHNRMSFQKKKMAAKLRYFDPELSESINMKNNGYLKIWNCGNDAWLYNIDDC